MVKQSCRVCGCTDDDCRQCIITTGRPCYWVEKDLCSACAPGEVNIGRDIGNGLTRLEEDFQRLLQEEKMYYGNSTNPGNN